MYITAGVQRVPTGNAEGGWRRCSKAWDGCRFLIWTQAPEHWGAAWVWELLEQSSKLPEMDGFRCQQRATAKTCGAAAGKSPAPMQHRHAGWLLGSGTAASHGRQVLNSRLCLQRGTWSLGFNYWEGKSEMGSEKKKTRCGYASLSCATAVKFDAKKY